MKKINNNHSKELELKWNDKCLPLLAMSNKIHVDNQILPIDPYLLSLFDEANLRKNKKSGLYKIFSQSDYLLRRVTWFILLMEESYCIIQYGK